jgi:hypothetical protein
MKQFNLRNAKHSYAYIMQMQTVFPLVMYFERNVQLGVKVMIL